MSKSNLTIKFKDEETGNIIEAKITQELIDSLRKHHDLDAALEVGNIVQAIFDKEKKESYKLDFEEKEV